jgi:hypothetical protein
MISRRRGSWLLVRGASEWRGGGCGEGERRALLYILEAREEESM